MTKSAGISDVVTFTEEKLLCSVCFSHGLIDCVDANKLTFAIFMGPKSSFTIIYHHKYHDTCNVTLFASLSFNDYMCVSFHSLKYFMENSEITPFSQ